MTNVIYYLAASEGGEGLPLEKSVNPLLPASYDVVWSAVSLIVVLFLFWKFVLPKFQEVLTEREDRIKGGIQPRQPLKSTTHSLLRLVPKLHRSAKKPAKRASKLSRI